MAQRKFSVDSQLSVLDNRYISRRASLAYSATPELPEPTAGMTPTGMKTRWKRAFFNLKKTGNLKHKESMERIPQDYAGGGSDSKIKTSNGQKSVSQLWLKTGALTLKKAPPLVLRLMSVSIGRHFLIIFTCSFDRIISEWRDARTVSKKCTTCCALKPLMIDT